MLLPSGSLSQVFNYVGLKMKANLPIFLLSSVLVLASVSLAHNGEDHGGSPSTKVVAQNKLGKTCKVLGVSSKGEYIPTKELTCFKNKKKAEAEGFVDVFTSSFKVKDLHPVFATLSGDQVVPAATTTATASCTGVMNHSTLVLRVVCAHNIPTFTAGHIHQGAAGVKGSMICASPNTENTLAFDCPLTPFNHNLLHAGELYVNLHSTDHIDGELRGQLIVP